MKITNMKTAIQFVQKATAKDEWHLHLSFVYWMPESRGLAATNGRALHVYLPSEEEVISSGLGKTRAGPVEFSWDGEGGIHVYPKALVANGLDKLQETEEALLKTPYTFKRIMTPANVTHQCVNFTNPETSIPRFIARTGVPFNYKLLACLSGNAWDISLGGEKASRFDLVPGRGFEGSVIVMAMPLMKDLP
jgi:hypothetical protein